MYKMTQICRLSLAAASGLWHYLSESFQRGFMLVLRRNEIENANSARINVSNWVTLDGNIGNDICENTHTRTHADTS